MELMTNFCLFGFFSMLLTVTSRSLPATKSLDLDKITATTSITQEKTRSTATHSMSTSQSDNHGFQSRHMATEDTAKLLKTDKRDESKGFFRNFLNRSARKLTAVTSKDVVEALPLPPKKETPMPVKEPERKKDTTVVPQVIAKEDTLSILDVLARARNGDHGSAFEAQAKSISIDKLHETDKAKLPPIKINDKSHQLGATQRQRVLPHDIPEASENPIFDAIGKHHSSDRSALIFASPMKTSCRIECRNMRQTQYRSEEFLSSERSGRYLDACDGSDDAGPHSISLPKSVWPNECANAAATTTKYIQSPVKLSSSPKWNQCQTKISSNSKLNESPSKTSVEKSKSFRLYTKAQSGSAEDNRYSKYKTASGGNMPSLPDLSASSPPRGSNEFVAMFLSNSNGGSGGGGGGGSGSGGSKTSNRESFSFDSQSSLGSVDSPTNRYDAGDFGYLSKSKLLRAELDAAKSPVTVDTTGDSVVAHKNLGEIEDSIDQLMKSSLTTVLRKSSTTDLYQVRTTTSDKSAAELIRNSDILEDKELGVATVVSPPLLQYSLTSSKLDTKAFGHSKSSSNIPEFLQVQLSRKDAAAQLKALSAEEEKKRRMSSESIEIADQRSSSADRHHLSKSNDRMRLRTRSATALDSSEDARSTDDSEFGDTTTADATTTITTRIVDVLENRKSVSDKKLKYEKRIEEIQHNIRRTSGSGSSGLGTETPPRRPSAEDDAPAVVLRNKRKSVSATNTPSDATPELMKVFARRSLKIKDPNDYLTDAELAACDIIEMKAPVAVSKGGVDSDKENQANVDTPPPVRVSAEKTIKTDAMSIKAKSNRISSIKERSEMLKQAASQAKDEASKPVGKVKTDNRFTAPIPPFQSRKSTNGVTIDDNIINNNARSSAAAAAAAACAINNNLNSTRNGGTATMTTPGDATIKSNATDDLAQFKGILERRAEWEKRATQAFK